MRVVQIFCRCMFPLVFLFFVAIAAGMALLEGFVLTGGIYECWEDAWQVTTIEWPQEEIKRKERAK